MTMPARENMSEVARHDVTYAVLVKSRASGEQVPLFRFSRRSAAAVLTHRLREHLGVEARVGEQRVEQVE